MALQKHKPIRSQALRDSANGEQCTLNIAGICSYDPATVVLCHLPGEGHGLALKNDDLMAVFGCHRCHDVIDGRDRANRLTQEDRDFYTHRAHQRTLRRWVDQGLVTIKGMR